MAGYKRIIKYTLIGLLVLFSLAPFLWQALTSVKPDDEIARLPTVYLPHSITSSHYYLLFARKPFALYLLNSFIVSGLATVGCLAIGSLAAYAFARLYIPARRLLLWGI